MRELCNEISDSLVRDTSVASASVVRKCQAPSFSARLLASRLDTAAGLRERCRSIGGKPPRLMIADLACRNSAQLLTRTSVTNFFQSPIG